MNTTFLGLPGIPLPKFFNKPLITMAALPKQLEPFILFLILLITWCFAPAWLRFADHTVGNIDQGIWLLIILSLLAFLMITWLCWWLLHRFWLFAGLPPFSLMVSQFKSLELWQQLGFYWASFALVLLAALGSLIAIC